MSVSDHERYLREVIELSTHYYWEQDKAFRFTRLWGRGLPDDHELVLRTIGRTAGELDIAPSDEETSHLLINHSPIDNAVFVRRGTESQPVFLSVSARPKFDDDGGFAGYFGVAREITDSIASERFLLLEERIATLLCAEGNATEIVQHALEAICQEEHWDAGLLWQVHHLSGTLRVAVAWHRGGSIADVIAEAQHTPITKGRGLVGKVWESRQPLWTSSLDGEDQALLGAIARVTDWSTALLVPVVFQERVTGVLDFRSRRIPEPDRKLLQILSVLGVQIGSFYERMVSIRKLKQREEIYSSTVELAAVGIAHVSPTGQFLHVNQQFCTMLGYTREELLGMTVKDVSHPTDANVTDTDRDKLHAGSIRSFATEKRYVRKDGASIWVRATVAVKRDHKGTPLYDISVVEDISSRKEAEARIQYLATHDEMTGLLNRAMLLELLQHAIKRVQRHGPKCAILFIDLDRFKAINDSLGHNVGDQFLSQIAHRLRTHLRASDAIARLGGDEFVVLVEDIVDKGEAAEVARNILGAVMQPVRLGKDEYRVTASVGIVLCPDHGKDASSLMKFADIAMYHAKEEGKNNFQFYSKDIFPLSIERLTLETRLSRALENDEFVLHYQPKIDLATGEISGTEALIRWWNHELGLVSPGNFVPIAEETGLIVPIGKWVLKTACAQSVEWHRMGLPRIVMAVNLSPRQFRDPGLTNDIAEILAETHMPPEYLELEITESMIMTNIEDVMERISEIKSLGVRLAIDDFGTGYSSLSQLKRFPIDTLKVDRSFIRDVPGRKEDNAITEAIISMGRTLGVTVVAEGVETTDQEDFLRLHRCDAMQGFLFSKPCHPDAFAELLRRSVTRERHTA